jgi:hypothetical protein
VLKKIALPVSLVLVLAFAGAAFAGKPSSPSSITGPFVVTGSLTGSAVTATSTSTPHYGDTITFDVYSTATDNPFVNVTCYQDGVLVMQGWSAFFAGGLGDGNFGLGSPVWRGGAAECTANLDMYSKDKLKVLTSTSFHVDA